MKWLFPSLLIFLEVCFILPYEAGAAPGSDGPGLYQWTDESGTVNFSDNTRNVPGEYKKGVRVRDSIKGETSPQKAESDKHQQATPAEKIYGGHDEKWWRRRFADQRAQIRTIKETLPKKRERLKSAHIKKAASDSLGYSTIVHGNHRQNRVEYKKLYYEIKADEEKMAALEKELVALDVEAYRAGVPFEWRKEAK